jgi:hypothetical protein
LTNWSQPNEGWFSPTNSPNYDGLTPKVHLTRGSRDRLFNGVTEGLCNRAVSPADTEWASGTLANFSTLTYHPFSAWVDGLGAGNVNTKIINKPAVAHLKSENIYLSVNFTSWTPGGAGGFAYQRSTPATVVPPTVSITSPTNGAVFAAPATITIAANASVNGGSVTNVTFLSNGDALGSDKTSPFSITASNLAAATYSLRAVATAGGISTTSSAVSITVVSPVAITSSGATVSNGIFSFSYTANAGLKYVVQSTSNFQTWSPGVTNVPLSSPVKYSENVVPDSWRFYRVFLLPNP